MAFPGLLMLAALTAVATDPVDERMPVDLDWSRSSLWDDGRAEVAHYESHRSIYAVDRSFETVLITVKEDFDRARAVKADPPHEIRDLLSVLKLNIIARVQTENYPYDFMTSVFVRRDDPRALVKVAASSQEWCGTTFKEVITWDGPARLEFHSYFDGQGDGSTPLDLSGGALLEEQLFLVMRAANLQAGREYRFPLYDSLTSNSAGPPSRRSATAILAGEETLVTPAGSIPTRRIEVRLSAALPAMTFWIEKEARRALVRVVMADGRSLLLTRISRRDYWTRRN